MKIAMLGTRGVPAQYGGFETAIEEIGQRLAERGHHVVVYCRNPEQQITQHLGMDLVNLPALRVRTLETLSHSLVSSIHAISRSRPDVAFVFNAGNAPFLPILKFAQIPVAVHMDGLEWKRTKWAGAGSRYYKWAERSAARSGAALIADAEAIADYLHTQFGRSSRFIPYGAPIVSAGSHRLEALGYQSRAYHLVVARMEPENHVDVIVEGYLKSGSLYPLLVVGSAPYSDTYCAAVSALADRGNVQMLGSVWDQDLLNELYANCRSYLHGHSVGGTNPSLLRAMGCGAPVSAFDVSFNREVARSNANYFLDAESVAECIRFDDAGSAADRRGAAGRGDVAHRYDWDDVATKYENLAIELGADTKR